MIVFIADMQVFAKESSLNRYRTLQDLEKEADVRVVTPQNFKLQTLDKKDVIIFYFLRPHAHASVDSIIPLVQPVISRCHKIFFYIEDIYHIEKIMSLCRRFQIYKLIFSISHQKFQQRFPSHYSIQVWDHSIDLTLFRNLDQPKRYDIVFYGNINPKIYPFRARLFRVIFNNPLLRHLKKKVVPFRGYKHQDTVEQDLSVEIASAWLSIATTSKYNFLTKKYIEIPCCGTMILGNIPTNYRHIFNYASICKVTPEMSNMQIAQKILECLADKDKLSAQIASLKEKVSTTFDRKKSYANLKKLL